jgi:hypothetical protein
VVDCRLGEKGADGTRSHPELRERTCTMRTASDVEKAKVFGNVSVELGNFQSLSSASNGCSSAARYMTCKSGLGTTSNKKRRVSPFCRANRQAMACFSCEICSIDTKSLDLPRNEILLGVS